MSGPVPIPPLNLNLANTAGPAVSEGQQSTRTGGGNVLNFGSGAGAGQSQMIAFAALAGVAYLIWKGQ